MELDDMALLASLGRLGPISAAARARGIAISTAARRLDALEAALALRLVDRRADGARLTAEGQKLASLAAPLEAQMASIARAAAAMRAGGPAAVRITATESIIADRLAPALPRLWAAHPDIAVTLQSQGAVVSLAGREADVAVRMRRPEGNALIARALPAEQVALFASSAWLAGRDPAGIDPAAGPILAYDDSFGRIPEMAWLAGLGLSGAVRMATGSTRALLMATLAGAGIGLLPRRMALPAGLLEIPTETPAPVRTPWLTVHRDVRRLPAIRAVTRWIVAAFA
ncbi:MAG: substrate-binding domain-containing protein [Sphingomonadales bacterium]